MLTENVDGGFGLVNGRLSLEEASNWQDTETLFNIKLLILNKSKKVLFSRVTNLNIFVPSTNNFDPNGLFSNEIFGPVGDPIRNSTFGYIALHVGVIHPLVFKNITRMRAFYGDIMSGKKFATFNKTLGDFVLSTPSEGETGYKFFIDHMDDLKLDDRGSSEREVYIKQKELYGKTTDLIDRWLVLPAGLRDYYIDKSGKPEEDEVNDLYRKLMNLTNSIENIKITPSTESSINKIRYRIQLVTLEIYEHFRSKLDGKDKFIQGKFAKRAIVNGTRNVLTPNLLKIRDLDDPTNINIDHTVVGLYQYIRAISPITMHWLHQRFLSNIFNPNTGLSKLVNVKSLKTEFVTINSKESKKWLSTEGLDSIISVMKQNELRKEPVMVSGHYLLLLWDDGKDIHIIDNTDTLPDNLDPKYLRPITYYELFYISIHSVIDKYPGFVTRYPVINLGGIYPSMSYVKTTNNPRTINLHLTEGVVTLKEYPNYKDTFINGISVSPIHIDRLGADFDGDKVSYNVLYVEESINELMKLINSKEYYLDPNGGSAYSPISDTLKYVTKTLAGVNVG